jgi:hypothetical protein
VELVIDTLDEMLPEPLDRIQEREREQREALELILSSTNNDRKESR